MRSLYKKGFKISSYLLAVMAGITLFGSNAFASSCDTATMITSFPYYITSPGTYCLPDSKTFMSNSNSAIAAVTISASDVEFNLNGNAIKGPLTPNGSIATGGHESGITVTGYVNNVWIHNGYLAGLSTGIGQWTNTGSTTATNLVIQDMNFVDIKGIGIALGGTCDNCSIMNNAFYNINSSVCVTCSLQYVYAINVSYLTNSSITGNKIMGIHTYGDQWPGYGMYIAHSSGMNVNNNTIVDEPFSLTNNTAVIAYDSTNINMSGNTFSNIYRGIWYFYSSGTYSGTTYVNTTVPYTGGTNGGGNQ